MNKAAAQFIEAVSKYKAIAIYIPGSPDPDAIASAYAINIMLNYISVNSDIFAEHRLSLAQNRVFIERLRIPVIFDKKINPKKYQAYIVPDFQDNRIDYLNNSIPCAAHIDHHVKSNETIQADFSLIRTDVGSTSTLIALMVKNLNIEISETDMTSLATALTFGIQTDTDKYNNITPQDIEALEYLQGFADKEILQELNSMPPSTKTLTNYKKAREQEVVYKDWAFYGLGFIDARSRDSIAITADMLLKNTEHKTVAVFAVIENQRKGELFLDVSLRSKSRNIDLNRVIKQITPNGGGRRYKGAYQVRLNYFLSAPDRELLWKVIEDSTIETLRKSRDALYITGIKSIYGRVKDKFTSILKKDTNR
ncbi:MAG: DHH family phosphoesterase [Bacillota bacterium]|nr:DHH family phosphoesterase [Bacillota bacterium]